MYSQDLDWLFDLPKDTKATRYPLTDIGYTKDESIVIDIALAGFSEENVKIEMSGDNLVITGIPVFGELEPVDYVQQVISVKEFERIIRIPKTHLDGEITAKMEKGILSIKISKGETPKKVIEIQKQSERSIIYD